MFFKKKCYNCGAKNPEGLKACAMCGAPFALRQMNEQLEGRKRPAPAWPKEVGKEVEEEKAEEEAEITCPKCGTVFFVSHEEDAVICPNPECRAVPQTTRRYEERREFLNLIHPMQPWFIRLQVPSAEVSEQEIEMKEKTGFLDRLRERFRDHTRDNICAGLHTLGVDAKMDMRRRAEEENIGIGSLGTGSLGVIDIPEGPIRWVNVRRESMN